MVACLWWNHPGIECLRVFAIHFYAGNLVIHFRTINKTKFAVEIDLDQRSAMGLFRFVQLLPTKATGPLTVIKLIKSFTKNLRGSGAVWIKFFKCSSNCLQLRVNGGLARHDDYPFFPLLARF